MGNKEDKEKKEKKYVWVPCEVKSASPDRKSRPKELEERAEKDFRAFMDSMPDNYFTLFETDEIMEHYQLVARNSGDKFGELAEDTKIEISNPKHRIVICGANLKSLYNLIQDIEKSGRRIIHHHSFVPTQGKFQIIFIQTTDEHFQPISPDDRFDDKIGNVTIKLEKRLDVLVIQEDLDKISEKPKVPAGSEKPLETVSSTLEDHLSDGRFGDERKAREVLEKEFWPNINIKFRQGMDEAKLTEIAILFVQFIVYEKDLLVCTRKTERGLIRVMYLARTPGFMKSQKYLAYASQRLRYYQLLDCSKDERNFKYRGGFSTFLKGSENDQVEIGFFYLAPLDKANINCLSASFLEQELGKDLLYKIVTKFNSLSIFDILGPIMVGPSSSHTAGANRLGRLSSNIISTAIAAGKITEPLKLVAHLHDSFESTGLGHGTPHAVLGGLLGFKEDDERISSLSKEVDPKGYINKMIRINGVDFEWRGFYQPEGGLLKDYKINEKECHENTALFMIGKDEPITMNMALLYIIGESYGGGNIRIREIGGKIFGPKSKPKIFKPEEEEFSGKYSRKIPELFGETPVERILSYPPENVTPLAGRKRPRIVELDDILYYAREKNRIKTTIPEIAMEYELSSQNVPQRSIVEDKLNELIRKFKEIACTGISGEIPKDGDSVDEIENSGQSTERLLGPEFKGGNGVRLKRFADRNQPLGDTLSLQAAAYAISIGELNAQHKTVVAAPTAGASGILPGVLAALCDKYAFSKKELYDGLLTAGFIGVVINNIVPTSGSSHGCQAETGIGCALAAAMATQFLGGTTEQILEATALALKNSFGLVCDPIAGKVEIPCIKRNGFKAVEALVATGMALAGIKSAVPASEIVKAMDEIGKNMNKLYRETSGGGLARTTRGRDEQRLKLMCQWCN